MNAAVSITLVDQKLTRPPTQRLFVDVQLRNDDPAPRWVLIPELLPVDASGGIDKLEQLSASAGGSSVTIGRFSGRAAMYGIKLAPGARVTLRKLELSWWHEDPKQKDVTFDVRLASDVMLGDTAIATWFDNDPAISGAADVDMASAKPTRKYDSPTGDEVPLAPAKPTAAPIKLTVP